MTTPENSSATDKTSIIHGDERQWLPIPGAEGVMMKVLLADEILNQVVFMFRFAPGTVLPRHKHLCHAIGYTVSGSWQYETGVLRAGSLAYEPFDSEHVPSSTEGAEIVVFLKSQNDLFLENVMPDGSTFTMDMNFFKLLQSLTPEQASELQIPGMGDARPHE
jgi:quercetin dioxygenase-like cupin family protein